MIRLICTTILSVFFMSFSYLIYQFGGHGGYEIATVAFLISVALAVITLRIK